MIRKGMWCVDGEGRVGIINALAVGVAETESGERVPELRAEFHLVNAKGETVQTVVVPAAGLVQARYREIPEPRRKLAKERFAALGYV